jgi:hypothetical protein
MSVVDRAISAEHAADGRFNGRILSCRRAYEDVGDRKDYRCDMFLLPVIHTACIADGMSLFNEHKFLCGAAAQCIASLIMVEQSPNARFWFRLNGEEN